LAGTEKSNKQRNVRDGSKADAEAYSRHVLFSSELKEIKKTDLDDAVQARKAAALKKGLSD
jgi:hypothetical protein